MRHRSISREVNYELTTPRNWNVSIDLPLDVIYFSLQAFLVRDRGEVSGNRR